MAYGWRPHAMLCRWALPSAVPANGCCLTAFWSVSAVPQGAAPSSACWDAPSYLRAGWLSCAGVCPLRVRSVCGLVTGALAWRLAEKVQKALGSAVNMWRVHWGQVRRAAVWYLVAVSLQEAGCSDQKQSAVAYTVSNRCGAPPSLACDPAALALCAGESGPLGASMGKARSVSVVTAGTRSGGCDGGRAFKR